MSDNSINSGCLCIGSSFLSGDLVWTQCTTLSVIRLKRAGDLHVRWQGHLPCPCVLYDVVCGIAESRLDCCFVLFAVCVYKIGVGFSVPCNYHMAWYEDGFSRQLFDVHVERNTKEYI